MVHKAKKSMGQNFLKSKEALFKMCEAGGVEGSDIVVEIGPGKGALTEKLLERAKKVFALEMDRDLVTILEERFKEEIKNKKLEIIEGDCLDFNPDTFFKNTQYKIIANIPYNITGSIIRKFLSDVKNKPTLMALLVQKEVAERIVARDGKESILSLSVKAYATPKYIMKVHKRFFSPEPKVDSAIISINDISNKFFKEKSGEELFFRLIKTGFAHKRKVLRKNLEDLQHMEVRLPNIKEVGLPKIDEIFEKLEINPKARAEDIKFEKWIQISRLL
ncbi:MAG: 16S rRNA (adenine(1518)-N(6)/adenine(1519)-N(6))-dimethyltransferase RsmA [Candidatus Paceibacterota bacterium]